MSMSARPLIADGLWNCLCPSFRPNRTPCLRQLPNLAPRVPRRKLTSATKTKSNFTSTYRDPFVNENYKPLQFDRPPRESISQTLAPPSYYPWKQDEIETKLDPIDTEVIYNVLDREALRQDCSLVWDLVTYLVQKRKESPNRRLYGAMIRACIQESRGSAPMLRELVEEMKSENILLDAGLCASIFEALAVHPDFFLLNEIIEHMRENWIELSDPGYNFIVVSLLRNQQVELAMDKIDEMNNDGIRVQPWVQDMLYYVLAERGAHNLDTALEVFKQREENSAVSVTAAMWQHLLDIGSQSFHYEAVKFVWRRRVELGYLVPPTGICLNVLATASKAGDTQLAIDTFRILSQRKVPFDKSHYEHLIQCYLTAGELQAALTILPIMINAKIYPDSSTTRWLYRYLRTDPSLPGTAMDALRNMKWEGYKIPLCAIDVILEACIEHSNLEEALSHWMRIRDLALAGPNTSTMNMVLRGCYKHKRKDLALYFAKLMIEEGIQPDEMTYDHLVLACVEDENLDDSMRYYDEMRARDWSPRDGTWRTLVTKLARAEDARCEWVVKDMVAAEVPVTAEPSIAIRESFGVEASRSWLSAATRPKSWQHIRKRKYLETNIPK